jgi:RHS repeat-associated protein
MFPLIILLSGISQAITTPTAKATVTDYFKNDLVKSIIEPSTQATTFTYDTRLRPLTKIDPVATVIYGYNNADQLTTVTEGSTIITRDYDERGRLKSFTTADGDFIQYRYDANNNLTRLTYPDGKQVHYTYNARNLLETVTDWNNRVTTYQYDRLGRLTGTIRPNGTANHIAHDAANQLTSIKETANGKLINYLKIDYDAASQITRRFRAPLVNSGWQHPTFTATYDDDNRLATLNGQNITHDADGNMTYGPIRQDSGHLNLTYNSRNQLTQAAGIAYTYDAEGRRRTITDTTGTSRDVIDPNGSLSRLLVRHHPDNTKTYYVYGLGLLYEVDENENTKTHHFDQVGSTIARTDDTGKVIGRAEYSAYGITFWKQGDMATPFLYNGQAGVQTDANGLLNMRARYYSPFLMRFLNADPIGFSGGSNWFAYADGNPISLYDPFGLCPDRNLCTGGTGRGNAYTRNEIRKLGILTEVAFGFSPAGPVLDAADFLESHAQDNWGGMALAGVSVIPGGDLLKLRKFDEVVTGTRIPDLKTGVGYDAGDIPIRIEEPWSINDMKQGLLGHPPRGLGSPDIHHGGQMPGGALHEVIPSQHRNNSALHPYANQGVTPEMRQSDRQLHWWYRAREQGADQTLPDWIYD